AWSANHGIRQSRLSGRNESSTKYSRSGSTARSDRHGVAGTGFPPDRLVALFELRYPPLSSAVPAAASAPQRRQPRLSAASPFCLASPPGRSSATLPPLGTGTARAD